MCPFVFCDGRTHTHNPILSGIRCFLRQQQQRRELTNNQNNNFIIYNFNHTELMNRTPTVDGVVVRLRCMQSVIAKNTNTSEALADSHNST